MGGLDSLLSKRPSSPEVEGGGPERVPERRPPQLRFNEPSVQLELIKTRLELSRVSDLHTLKPPRIHPSLFPVNNWAPVGFLGRAGRLTSSLHGELEQGRPGGKGGHRQASSYAPTPPTRGGWELVWVPPPLTGSGWSGLPAGAHRAHSPGSLASLFPSFTWSTNLHRAAENCENCLGRQWPSPSSECPHGLQGALRGHHLFLCCSSG